MAGAEVERVGGVAPSSLKTFWRAGVVSADFASPGVQSGCAGLSERADAGDVRARHRRALIAWNSSPGAAEERRRAVAGEDLHARAP